MFLPSVNVCRRESGVRFRAALKAFLPPARASQAGLKKSPPFASLQVVFFCPALAWGTPLRVFGTIESPWGAS